MRWDGENVLFESISSPSTVGGSNEECTWLVDTGVATTLRGIVYRDADGNRITSKRSLLPWGTLVAGTQVDEHWVKVGEYFLPTFLPQSGQVLWPQNKAPAQLQPASSSSSGSRTVRMYLLAPPSKGEYRLTGSVAGGWGSHLVLESQTVTSHLANILKHKQVQYVDLPISALDNAEFKFQRHEKEGILNTVQNMIYAVLVWEYEGENNRTIKLDVAASTLYMSFGSPVPSEDDVVDFIKVALVSGESLQEMNMAVTKVNEVQQSVLSVTCKKPTRVYEGICIRKCLQRALSEVLSGLIQPKPCGGLYIWLAVLEQEMKGDLRGLHTLVRQELLSLISGWPTDVMAHDVLDGRVHEAAKGAVLEESGFGGWLTKQWLEAAIQVVLNGAMGPQEVAQLQRHASRVPSECWPNWGAIAVQQVPLANIESALRVALEPQLCPARVWLAAAHFLNHIDRPDVMRACVCIALDQALICCGVNNWMNWQEVVVGLDSLLDKVVEGTIDAELQQDLTMLIREHSTGWNSWRVVIPDQPYTGKALGILAGALTAEPHQACNVAFQDQSELAWFRLAAMRCEELAPA